MTIDDYVVIPYKLLIFDLFCLKLIHNQYDDIIKTILANWNRQTTQIKQKQKKKSLYNPYIIKLGLVIIRNIRD